ncbi:CNNM domain-containing protein [Psychroflexus tropicus]|uniref:CNNM domain-containing protein n=1 Tax=Psychroflexus tropicus TaxID=197345 RepID=UPI000368CE32|nr:hemolysin family protein [Psychroflexus tropicus]
MFLLFAYLFLALFVSFLCSIMESVLLSANRSFLIVKAEGGELWAKSFLNYKKEIDKPLSAILSLNTVAHTIGAAGVGAQAVKVFGEAYFGVVSAVLTILILVVTEIIPKTLGARYWKSFAKGSYYILRGMIVITYPLVVLSSVITKMLSSNKNEKTTSREEIAALASIANKEGLFTEKENKIIQNILHLKNIEVEHIMTPRVVVEVEDEDTTLKNFLKTKTDNVFSRIPVYSGNEDNFTGYVFRQQLLEKLADDQHHLKLKELRREIIVVSGEEPLFSLWETLLQKREHIALVVGEYGGLDGIVTMEDIIETILGLEIMDEKDFATDMQKYAKDLWNKKKKYLDGSKTKE